MTWRNRLMPYPIDPRLTNAGAPSLSIIVPVLDEASIIVGALQDLASFRRRGAEVIVVDGGSRDGTPDLARPHADDIVTAARGRGAQMNAGAVVARGEVLLFLHADTKLPPEADRLLLQSLAGADGWGRFDVRIEGRSPLLAVVAALMNWRSRLTGIATGDHAMFITRSMFAEAGGFPEIPLMEDVALSQRLKRIARPICLTARVVTSGRRWEQHGVMRTMLMMWRLRLAFFLGADPAALARRYGYGKR
jgi:rSAM/selenodomain-associated transferase 2